MLFVFETAVAVASLPIVNKDFRVFASSRRDLASPQ
jgi:hypothetical protein